jgi:dTDP-4-dehydrorhamnose 3,5-epimerase
MQIIQTGIEGLLEIRPEVFHDSRGWFYEFYKDDSFRKAGITYSFPQENISFSKKGVIRGLHFQRSPWEQAKLVSVLSGKVLDVVVDIRKGSPTFASTYSCVLDANQHNLLMVPEGFAHGFAALEDSVFLYKISNLYNRDAESGIIWNDPQLKINWPFANPVLAEKDQKLDTLSELLRKSVISQV